MRRDTVHMAGLNRRSASASSRRVVSAELLVVDPILRWCLTLHGGYRLPWGTPARDYSEWPRQRSEGH